MVPLSTMPAGLRNRVIDEMERLCSDPAGVDLAELAVLDMDAQPPHYKSITLRLVDTGAGLIHFAFEERDPHTHELLNEQNGIVQIARLSAVALSFPFTEALLQEIQI